MSFAVRSAAGRLVQSQMQFFLCDVQEKFRAKISYMPAVIEVARRLVRFAVLWCHFLFTHKLRALRGADGRVADPRHPDDCDGAVPAGAWRDGVRGRRGARARVPQDALLDAGARG